MHVHVRVSVSSMCVWRWHRRVAQMARMRGMVRVVVRRKVPHRYPLGGRDLPRHVVLVVVLMRWGHFVWWRLLLLLLLLLLHWLLLWLELGL